MKKLLLLMLALCLFCTAASAEVKTVSAGSLTLNKSANTFVVYTAGRNYQVVDADMNPLSSEYDQVSSNSYGLYTVKTKDGSAGLLSARGEVLINPEYGDIKIINDRWYAGVRLTESTAENYDYKTYGSDPKFYLVDTVDIFYYGTLLHTFTRMEYDSANAVKDYLIVTSRDKKYTAYNKEFTLSPFVPDSGYSEYKENWNTGKIIHVGSGQEAFTAGCTLTPDEVEKSVWIKKDRLVDLQGNELADLTPYYSKSVDNATNLIKVRDNYKKYGLLDATGKELIPCKYDELGYNLDIALVTGYLYAVRDGKSGFVCLKDGSEKGFEFLESAGKQRSAFIVIEDPREGTILISCAAGELPGRYKSVEIPYTSAAMFATVEEMDGRIHVIDVYGNETLEDNPEIKYTYDADYSNDGTMILVRDIERQYHIYTVDPSAYAPVAPSAPEAPAADDGAWTCENGHEGNTGNFCTVCGAKKPEPEPEPESETWTCENGHEGNIGNFCPVCGAKKPEPPADWTCENGHAGNTGNFCSVCGAKKPE